MSETAHPQPWMLPFFELNPWLRRRARASASTRPGLDADDLHSEVLTRYLAEAEDWFEGETTTTPRQRARNFMKYLLLQEVTRYDRRVARERRGALKSDADADAIDDQVFDIEAVAISESHDHRMQVALDHPVVHAQVLGLPNRVYRLTFMGLFLSTETTHSHFEEGKSAILRALDEAWNLFGDHRQTEAWVEQEPHRRRTFGEILRSDAPMGTLSTAQLTTCYGWLNRTAYRARQALCAQLDALDAGGIA